MKTKWSRRAKPNQESWSTWAKIFFKANPIKCISVALTVFGLAQLVSYSVSIGFLQNFDLKSVPSYLLVIAVFGVFTAVVAAAVLLGPGLWPDSPAPIQILCQTKANKSRDLWVPQSAPGRCYLIGATAWSVIFLELNEWLLAIAVFLPGFAMFVFAETLSRKNDAAGKVFNTVSTERVEATWIKQVLWTYFTMCYGVIGFLQIAIIVFLLLAVKRSDMFTIVASFSVFATMLFSMVAFVQRGKGVSPAPLVVSLSLLVSALTVMTPQGTTKYFLNILGLGGMRDVSLRVTQTGCNLINSYGSATNRCTWNPQNEIGEMQDVEVLLAIGTTYYISIAADVAKIGTAKKTTSSGPKTSVRIRIPADHVRSIGR